jgi:hypothetical protein
MEPELKVLRRKAAIAGRQLLKTLVTAESAKFNKRSSQRGSSMVAKNELASAAGAYIAALRQYRSTVQTLVRDLEHREQRKSLQRSKSNTNSTS